MSNGTQERRKGNLGKTLLAGASSSYDLIAGPRCGVQLNWAVISCGWGNQQGTQFRAEAVYDRSVESFLLGFFPCACLGSREPATGDIPGDMRNVCLSCSLLHGAHHEPANGEPGDHPRL
jgi:hypothetical protein